MNVNNPIVAYSSIVSIGEEIIKLENETGEKYLKLHRGVMDVTTINVEKAIGNLSSVLNDKLFQQYSGNDGYLPLIETIKNKFNLIEHNLIITPGGMASLDLIINSISNKTFFIPEYHWGSWNKILKIHDKTIMTFNDLNLNSFKPFKSIVMLCYPSNPTGYMPSIDVLKKFLRYAKKNEVTVILDLPYYYLFNEFNDSLSELFYDNVILLSSFSKSIGLSGYRIGFLATKNKNLFDSLRIRSLYKYNSISTLPQFIINSLLEEENEINKYKSVTIKSIEKNISLLKDKNLLWTKYKKDPIGPFSIIKMSYKDLLSHNISSVPLSKFTINKTSSDEALSRISVAVEHKIFKEYFDKI